MPSKTEIKAAQALLQNYCPAAKEVERFVKKNPNLLALLCETPQHISSIFGRDVELTLELHKDPEEAYDELFVVIKTKQADAVELLERLDKWFLPIAKDVDNKLNFTITTSNL